MGMNILFSAEDDFFFKPLALAHPDTRVGVNSAPELDFLGNSKSNSGIGIELELALPSPGGIGIELELP